MSPPRREDAAAVRWYEGGGREPLTLPGDAGLVAPWLAVALTTGGLATAALFVRRRAREVAG